MNGRLFQNVLMYDELASTNSQAKLLLSERQNLNFIVWTKKQSEGRGQRGNSWFCGAEKDVAMSLVYYPQNQSVEKQFLLNVFVCNAVHAFVSKCLPNDKVEIKWPNDILVNERKICGILIENSVRGSLIDHSVIGIGLNLNSTNFPNYLERATSIQMHNKSLQIDQQKAVLEIALCVERELIECDEAEALDKYLKHLLGLNRVRRFKQNSLEFEGLIKGVEADGKLCVLSTNGTQYFGFKEIEFVLQ